MVLHEEIFLVLAKGSVVDVARTEPFLFTYVSDYEDLFGCCYQVFSENFPSSRLRA